MIVTGDVLVSSSMDDVGIQVDVKEEVPMQQSWIQPPVQQSDLSLEHALPASSSLCQSQAVSNSQASPAAPAFASVAHNTKGRGDLGSMQCSSDWLELEHCLYPVGPVRQTNFEVIELPIPIPLHDRSYR
jgi:hypothetical protein